MKHSVPARHLPQLQLPSAEVHELRQQLFAERCEKDAILAESLAVDAENQAGLDADMQPQQFL